MDVFKTRLLVFKTSLVVLVITTYAAPLQPTANDTKALP